MISSNAPIIAYKYMLFVIANKSKNLSDHQQTRHTKEVTTSVHTLQCLVCVCVPISSWKHAQSFVGMQTLSLLLLLTLWSTAVLADSSTSATAAGAAEEVPADASPTWSAGVPGELALISARLHRLAIRLDSNRPLIQPKHQRHTRVHERSGASQAAVEVESTPLVASTEVNIRPYSISIHASLALASRQLCVLDSQLWLPAAGLQTGT
jgi:hypothetical protein